MSASFRNFLLLSIVTILFPLGASVAEVIQKDIPLYHVGNRIKGWAGDSKMKDNYLDNVQAVMNARCIACHGCFEAPCQLNMQSYEGVRRGYNPIPIFSAKRVDYTAPTRMTDPLTLDNWRALNFLPVVAHHKETPFADQPDAYRESLLYRFVDQSFTSNKEHFPLNDVAQLQKDYLDDDKRACVATSAQFAGHFATSNKWGVQTYEDFKKRGDFLGMPLGLVRLEENQQQTLVSWMVDGAPEPDPKAQIQLETPTNAAPIEAWEDFLNRDTNDVQALRKSLLTSRYIYEHVYSSLLLFDENPGEYFDLVRAYERRGPIRTIVKEHPTNDPQVARPYYRLKKVTRAIVQKTTNVWHLNKTKLDHLNQMFLVTDWKTTIPAPDYSTTNIFGYFSPIPATIRSQFMRENSKLIVGAMVQGMVCIGSTATYAIADHFWSWFLKPEVDPSVQNPTLGLPSLDILNTKPIAFKPRNIIEERLLEDVDKLKTINRRIAGGFLATFRKALEFTGFDSASEGGDEHLSDFIVNLHQNHVRAAEIFGAVEHYLRTTHANQVYQEAFELELRRLLKKQKVPRSTLTMNDLWTGDGDPNYAKGNNPNAWLNITRHERNTSVQYGAEGGDPQSIWILSYSNFERLYYNLVADYKAWGNTTHKMATWRHMSYVRLEGEDLAISVLPKTQRPDVRSSFTRGLGAIKNKLFFPLWSTVDMRDKPLGRLQLSALHAFDLPAREGGHPELAGATWELSVHNIVTKLKERFKAVSDEALINDGMVSKNQRDFEQTLLGLQNKSQADQKVPFAQFMPNVAYVRVEGPDKQWWVYSIVADREYKSHNLMLLEKPNRDEQFDTLAIYRGFVGAYPEIFLEIEANERNGFARRIASLTSVDDYERLRSDYGVRRNTTDFLTLFDWVHELKGKPYPGVDPTEQGVVDLSMLQVF